MHAVHVTFDCYVSLDHLAEVVCLSGFSTVQLSFSPFPCSLLWEEVTYATHTGGELTYLLEGAVICIDNLEFYTGDLSFLPYTYLVIYTIVASLDTYCILWS